MSNDNAKITEKEFDRYVRGFEGKMPQKVKDNVLEEIRQKRFEKSMESKETPEKDEPGLER